MSENDRAANGYRRRTNLVRGGTHRTDFQETSEAIFATSGYVYKSAEEAEARFSSIENGTSMSLAGGFGPWMCQAGLFSFCSGVWSGQARRCW